MKYTLKELEFNLIPPGLPAPVDGPENHDSISAEDAYRSAYYAVYKCWPKHPLGIGWESAVDNALKLGMDFKTFCLVSIAGFAATHKFTPFNPFGLREESSVETVEVYRKACLKRYGLCDPESIGLLLDMDLSGVDTDMLMSEVSFGRYVTLLVSHGIKDSEIPFYVYDYDEIGFNHYWLATEDTYMRNTFADHCKERMSSRANELAGSDAQLKHRHLVSQVVSAMKKSGKIAASVFLSRSRIMRKATRCVFKHLPTVSDSTRISSVKLVTNAYSFWKEVGEAAK